MKHRKNWSEWGKKRAAEHRMNRLTNEIVVKMLTEQIDRMHEGGGLIARFMAPKPLPFFGGTKINSPIIYKEL